MDFLIKQCEIDDSGKRQDVRLTAGVIAEIGSVLAPRPGEALIPAHGGRLLPGLHDHHVHLASMAASLESIHCGPPTVTTQSCLARHLAAENNKADHGWLRGIGYHSSVAGDIDRYWLDEHIPDRPARIQHRGGRLWVLNSAGLEALGLLRKRSVPGIPAGVERTGGVTTGRLYESDAWLRTQLNSRPPPLHRVSRLLASYGVTGVTDTTPSNAGEMWRHFKSAGARGELMQDIRMMGSLELAGVAGSPEIQHGEYKIHLLEAQLPGFDTLCATILRAHQVGRTVAIHCVTLTELLFALACLEEVGSETGDRIEHASITSPETLAKIAQQGLRVVTQPHFVSERGAQYLRNVETGELPWLYRLRSFLEAGIPLAGGSDAPFGSPDPWASMAAAVHRTTSSGECITPHEALSPEQALRLFTSTPDSPGLDQRVVKTGSEASVCLLDCAWKLMRQNFSSDRVVATWSRGDMIYRASGDRFAPETAPGSSAI
ncbi:hypothetical protein E2F43_18790 [Seongchinamella unica]|uniref:Amidohydrolase 3 domain-containing protein n=1 Tax=Seongchinamella unica TaxID=2547392 RepID=A0A4R5LMY1_9GAMM|nr:amidohydrolase family protein [Seongchinamella unica]TDG11304.1 hypothetical protein E2F43_18790 [Seongchinamella unica]